MLKLRELFSSIAIKEIKDRLIKFILVRLLKLSASGGLRVWLVTFIAENLFKELAEPLIKGAFIQIGYYYDKIDGKIKVKKISKARDNNDKQSYIDAVHRIIG